MRTIRNVTTIILTLGCTLGTTPSFADQDIVLCMNGEKSTAAIMDGKAIPLYLALPKFNEEELWFVERYKLTEKYERSVTVSIHSETTELAILHSLDSLCTEVPLGEARISFNLN